MKIKINGKDKDIKLGNQKPLLSNIVGFLGYKPNTIVIEVNNLNINSKQWDNKIIKDGDKLEIVSIVGGG